MSQALYMDVHVPQPITRGLRRRGVDVVTAQEDGTAELEDADLLDRAGQLGRILFTRDDDLLVEAATRMRRAEPFASVVHAHQLDVSIGRCIADLEVIAQAGTPKETRGQVIFLPL